MEIFVRIVLGLAAVVLVAAGVALATRAAISASGRRLAKSLEDARSCLACNCLLKT